MPTVIGRAASGYLLEIDGRHVGPLLAASGGEPVGTVVELHTDTQAFPKKHLASVGYRPLELQFDFAMQAELFEWIGAVLAGNESPLDGAVIEIDMAGRERSRLEFRRAVALGFNLPVLDAASRQPCRFTLQLQPEMTRRLAGSGAAVPTRLGRPVRALASAFRLQFDRVLDTSRVVTVQAPELTARVQAPQDPREPQAVQRSLGNLVCTAAVDPSWYQLVDSFLVQGQSGDADELEATLELLSADLRTVLLTVSMHHVGLVSVTTAPGAGRGALARLQAEFYVESMSLALPGAPAPAA